MNHLLEVKNLSVSYFTYAGEVQAVRGVDFVVDEGKTVAIVGESGCGKSVSVKAVMGLIEKPGVVKDGSKIIFDGKEIEQYTAKEWNAFRGNDCAMIFQDALVALNPTMTIGKQIVENLENHNPHSKKEQMEKKSIEMLEYLGIPDAKKCMNRYPHELSGGMRQRVMIAVAMVNRPRILIADEPTTALDVTIQAQILELMKKLQKENNMSIIMITHDLGIVAGIADEIVVMYAGKVVEKGNLRDIFYDAKHPYTWALINSVPKRTIPRKTTLTTIDGNIPDLTKVSAGCAFCDRCPYAMEICEKYQPTVHCVNDGHTVSCWLMDERADKENIPFMKGGERHE